MNKRSHTTPSYNLRKSLFRIRRVKNRFCGRRQTPSHSGARSDSYNTVFLIMLHLLLLCFLPAFNACIILNERSLFRGTSDQIFCQKFQNLRQHVNTMYHNLTVETPKLQVFNKCHQLKVYPSRNYRRARCTFVERVEIYLKRLTGEP